MTIESEAAAATLSRRTLEDRRVGIPIVVGTMVLALFGVGFGLARYRVTLFPARAPTDSSTAVHPLAEQVHLAEQHLDLASLTQLEQELARQGTEEALKLRASVLTTLALEAGWHRRLIPQTRPTSYITKAQRLLDDLEAAGTPPARLSHMRCRLAIAQGEDITQSQPRVLLPGYHDRELRLLSLVAPTFRSHTSSAAAPQLIEELAAYPDPSALLQLGLAKLYADAGNSTKAIKLASDVLAISPGLPLAIAIRDGSTNSPSTTDPSQVEGGPPPAVGTAPPTSANDTSIAPVDVLPGPGIEQPVSEAASLASPSSVATSTPAPHHPDDTRHTATSAVVASAAVATPSPAEHDTPDDGTHQAATPAEATPSPAEHDTPDDQTAEATPSPAEHDTPDAANTEPAANSSPASPPSSPATHKSTNNAARFDDLLAAGCRHVRNGQAKQGLAELQRAFDLRPRTSQVTLCMAEGQLALGKPRSAQALVERVLRQTPNKISALLLGGRIELALGNSTKARRLFERVLATDPNNRTARAQLDRLAP